MTEKETWDDQILSNLTDSDFELPNLDWVDEEEDDSDGLKTKEMKGVVVEEIGKDKLDETTSSAASHSTREILISLDNDRKKIITLQEGEFCKIEQKLLESLEDDPVFKTCIRKSYIVFQEYSIKFKTWVDFDKSKEICDGAHLKAIFVPKPKEESISHHKSRHKEKKHKRRRSSDLDSRSRSSSRRNRSHKHQKSDHCSENDNSQFLLLSSTDGDMTKTEDSCISSEPNMTVGYKEVSDSTFLETSHSMGCKEVSDSTFLETSHSIDSDCIEVGNSVINKHSVSSDYSLPTSTTSRTHSELPRFSVAEGQLYYLSLALKGKSPVTALHELCQKLRWGSPQFSLVSESELPERFSGFLMKVTIKGESFIPDTPSQKKKLAKNVAAEYALRNLGILK